jgi:hypothetical protein
MRELILSMLTALVLPSALALAQTGPSVLALQVRPDTKVDYWSPSQTALSYLVDIGIHNELPLGIVIEGDSLCTHQLVSTGLESTVIDVVSKIDMQIPGYTGEIQDGVLLVHPKVMQSGTLGALNLTIPQFSTSKSSPDRMGVSLWMYIRAILVPTEGSGFVGGTRRATESVPSFQVSNATVRTILNIVATKGQGGLWALHEVPSDWLKRPNTIPYEIYEYSDDRRYFDALNCASTTSHLKDINALAGGPPLTSPKN